MKHGVLSAQYDVHISIKEDWWACCLSCAVADTASAQCTWFNQRGL